MTVLRIAAGILSLFGAALWVLAIAFVLWVHHMYAAGVSGRLLAFLLVAGGLGVALTALGVRLMLDGRGQDHQLTEQ